MIKHTLLSMPILGYRINLMSSSPITFIISITSYNELILSTLTPNIMLILSTINLLAVCTLCSDYP